jgi:thymidylate synthase (FAD)
MGGFGVATDVRLISDITVRPIQQMGGDHMVVAAARVSTSGEDASRWADPSVAAESEGMINYLMKHRHGTPFEHASMTFFCHAPIFVWREWQRHRVGFSYNEESGRYKKLEPVFWVPRPDRPFIVPDAFKPARPKFEPNDDQSVYDALIDRSRRTYQACFDAYTEEAEQGIALEVARRLLPVGIYSSCWVTCNPRSLMHFLSLRTHSSEAAFISYPQAEIEEAANAAETFLANGWPLTYRAFVRNKRVAP